MSKLLLAFALTLVLVSAASAQYIYTSQDWQDGQGSWVFTGTTYQGQLVNDAVTNLLEEGNIAFQTDAIATAAPGQAKFLLPVTSKTWSLQWDMYNVAGSTRDFACVYGYSGGNESGTLSQVLALGQYNIPYTTAMYHFRVAFGPAASPLNFAGTWDTDGDPLTPEVEVGPIVASQNWGICDMAVAADTWHTMRMDQQDIGGGLALVKYYIDGVMVARWATSAVYAPTSIRMGGAVSNAGFSSYYDNISLTVPEPASMLALGTGLIGLLGLVRRRRA